MTDKEMAKAYREAAKALEREKCHRSADWLNDKADRLDPPLPRPGTVVWWQDTEGLSDPTLGQVNEHGRIEMFGAVRCLELHEVKWWRARTLAPGQVAVAQEILEDAERVIAWGEPEPKLVLQRVQDALNRDTEARR